MNIDSGEVISDVNVQLSIPCLDRTEDNDCLDQTGDKDCLDHTGDIDCLNQIEEDDDSEDCVRNLFKCLVKIDSMQFGFMTGKSTTDAIFIVRQLQEKYLARNKELWMAFVDLEKAFDRVPREVVWWALRCLCVDEWIVSVMKAMYADATTTVRVNGSLSPGSVR